MGGIPQTTFERISNIQNRHYGSIREMSFYGMEQQAFPPSHFPPFSPSSDHFPPALIYDDVRCPLASSFESLSNTVHTDGRPSSPANKGALTAPCT
jgi:hypothetical protein